MQLRLMVVAAMLLLVGAVHAMDVGQKRMIIEQNMARILELVNAGDDQFFNVHCVKLHVQPIVYLNALNSSSFVSGSTDGTVCFWHRAEPQRGQVSQYQCITMLASPAGFAPVTNVMLAENSADKRCPFIAVELRDGDHLCMWEYQKGGYVCKQPFARLLGKTRLIKFGNVEEGVFVSISLTEGQGTTRHMYKREENQYKEVRMVERSGSAPSYGIQESGGMRFLVCNDVYYAIANHPGKGHITIFNARSLLTLSIEQLMLVVRLVTAGALNPSIQSAQLQKIIGQDRVLFDGLPDSMRFLFCDLDHRDDDVLVPVNLDEGTPLTGQPGAFGDDDDCCGDNDCCCARLCESCIIL